MVEVFEQNISNMDRHSSKGNQLKWKSNGKWYKADYTGYEGLSEYMVSQLLRLSDLKEEEYIMYEPEQMRYKRAVYNGVVSNSFLQNDWQIITLERLFKNVYNKSLTEVLWHISDVKERLSFLVEQIERMTGLEHFGIYMNKLFTIDAMFLNEDRHMHNIAVLMNRKGEFKLCPFFDHGGSLLSDTTVDYPLGEDVYTLMREVYAKTISRDFDEQLDASEQLYGRHIHFSFQKEDVEHILDNVIFYSEEEQRRVKSIIFSQMNKYQYLF